MCLPPFYPNIAESDYPDSYFMFEEDYESPDQLMPETSEVQDVDQVANASDNELDEQRYPLDDDTDYEWNPQLELYQALRGSTRDGQWKEIGCETADDILEHMKSCQCDPECSVIDCRYFSMLTNFWPDCLPEDESDCLQLHGEQLDLLMHTSELGCDYDDVCWTLGCKYTEVLLLHLGVCQAGAACTVPKCWYFRQLRAHWEQCMSHFRYCPLCSVHKGSPPDARNNLFLFL